MKKFFMIITAGVLFFAASCSPLNKDELDYGKLEAQYVEVTPYWNMIFEDALVLDKGAALEFSTHYKNARDLINYWHKPNRRGSPESASDIQILWNLRNELKWASQHTNAMINPEL